MAANYKKCNNCEWFVNEIVPGRYSHRLAKKIKRGFCLQLDYFTSVMPSDPACPDYSKERNNELSDKA